MARFKNGINVSGLLVLAALSAAGCSTITNFSATWTHDDYRNQGIHKVLVIGMFERTGHRGTYESAVAEALGKRDIVAVSSLSVLPPNEEISEETFRKYFKDQNIDAVIITRLVSADSRQRWVPGYSYAVPYGYYNYYGYYARSWDVVHSPSYMVEETEINLETNIYAVPDGDLIWSGMSQTLDPADVVDAARSSAGALVRELRRAGILAESRSHE